MRVRKLILTSVVALMGLGATAQIRDVSFSAGVNLPMYQNIESDAVLNLSFGRFYRNGLGFRAGVQWSPSVSSVSNAFGVPVAFSYRTKARDLGERIESGLQGAAQTLVQEPWYSNEYDDWRDLAAGFMVNLFSDVETFVGITPGYIAGGSSPKVRSIWGSSWQYWEESWTEKRSGFSLTLDAGMTLNYRIWRFDLKLTPAFHYNLTKNYLYHSESGEKDLGTTKAGTQPLRWFFSFSGGLAFRF